MSAVVLNRDSLLICCIVRDGMILKTSEFVAMFIIMQDVLLKCSICHNVFGCGRGGFDYYTHVFNEYIVATYVLTGLGRTYCRVK